MSSWWDLTSRHHFNIFGPPLSHGNRAFRSILFSFLLIEVLIEYLCTHNLFVLILRIFQIWLLYKSCDPTITIWSKRLCSSFVCILNLPLLGLDLTSKRGFTFVLEFIGPTKRSNITSVIVTFIIILVTICLIMRTKQDSNSTTNSSI
mmetsp:Transcript_13496/g.20352  ORF Transcript_13496/g.20352 Transcript_13496/m.20352 type:complete len:148 (-) Transcript_13496:66-509(-)